MAAAFGWQPVKMLATARRRARSWVQTLDDYMKGKRGHRHQKKQKVFLRQIEQSFDQNHYQKFIFNINPCTDREMYE